MSGAAKTTAIAFGALGILAALAGWTWIAFCLAIFVGYSLQPGVDETPPPPSAPVDPPAPWQTRAIESLLAALQDGALVLDSDTRALCANAAARSMLAMRGSAVTGVGMSDLVDWPQLESALYEARRTGQQQTFEGAGPGTNGAQQLAVAVSAPDAHGILVVVVRDQSRLRQLESLRRDFVANVSHELKTPLAAIQGFVETMIDDPEMPNEMQSRFLDRVRDQSLRLSALVTDLLSLAKIEANEGRGERTLIDLRARVREGAARFGEVAARKRITLALELPEDACTVQADEESLRQILDNLLDNACKYTPEGGKVWARIVRRPGELRFEVEDTGIGIEPADQARVFERFYRVDKARSRDLGGTGLGLSIVKHLASSLGGTVSLESTPGRGSTFRVHFPA